MLNVAPHDSGEQIKIKFHDWEKKPRTVLRSIKVGDIFCFKFDVDRYGYGRIISRIDIGDCAEIFDCFTDVPCQPDLSRCKRSIPPVILDSYSLFDRKRVGDWRIIGHQQDFKPEDVENIYYSYGAESMKRRVDIWGQEERISDAEAQKYPAYTPRGDEAVKKLIRQSG